MEHSAKATDNTWQYVLYLVGAIALVWMRWYRIADYGWLDYDAVKNYDTATEITEGNFQHLFGHLSPSFHLLNALLWSFWPNFTILLKIHALIQVIILFYLCRLSTRALSQIFGEHWHSSFNPLFFSQ